MMTPSKSVKRIVLSLITACLGFLLFNSVQIYQFSKTYSDTKSDVAIVLGAGTFKGLPSPVFRERINHAKYLYDQSKVERIILTGGLGIGSSVSDSEVAKRYLITQGVPEIVILIEEESQYTIENLIEAKQIMDSLDYKTCLIVSDPLHMKRALALAAHQDMTCQPSPTQTSMYRSIGPKLNSLIYETFYYSLGELVGKH